MGYILGDHKKLWKIWNQMKCMQNSIFNFSIIFYNYFTIYFFVETARFLCMESYNAVFDFFYRTTYFAI